MFFKKANLCEDARRSAVPSDIFLLWAAGYRSPGISYKVWSRVSNTRAACGPRERFVRPTMLFGNFQII